jgi:TonB family protein
MKRAAFCIAVASVVACLVCRRLCADETPVQPRIGNLMIVPLDMHITKVNGRYTSQRGFHYVRFTASVKNVGHDAVCTSLSATLESTLNVGKRSGSWELKPRNGAATASGGFIHQLLPGEELEGTIVFGDLRDGVKPVTLTIESQRQSCGTTEGPESSPLMFAIRDSAGRAQISLLTNNRAVEPASANGSPPKHQHATTVSAPKAIYAPDAEYTEAARRAKLSGSVKLRVLVGKDGLVHDAVALNGLGMGLDENAIAAVRQWRFTPAMAEGKPVDLWINIDMDFRLY